MTDVVVAYDAVGLTLSAALAFLIGLRSAKAYSLTGRTHLLNFSAGFFCLAGSYLLTIATAVVLYYPPPYAFQAVESMLYAPNVLPRLFLELFGFSLIASSYFSRERAGGALLLALITGAALLAVLSSAAFNPFVGRATTGVIHLLDTALVLYTLIQISREYTTKVVPGSFFVSWGFGMLTLSQYTWSIWSYSNTLLTAEIAATLRIIGLLILVYILKK